MPTNVVNLIPKSIKSNPAPSGHDVSLTKAAAIKEAEAALRMALAYLQTDARNVPAATQKTMQGLIALFRLENPAPDSLPLGQRH